MWLLPYNIIRRLKRQINYLFDLKLRKNPMVISHREWLRGDGDLTLGINYPLNEDSIVFEVGGYKGEWSQKIASLYNPWIYIFEPVREYYDENVKRFKSNPKVRIYNFGLSDRNYVEKIAILEDGSSLYRNSNDMRDVKIRDIAEFFNESKIREVDLMQINIEGGEYALLRRMIDTGIVKQCKNIKIQFHNFIENATHKREDIITSLRKTHHPTYSFPFIWENWLRNKQ